MLLSTYAYFRDLLNSNNKFMKKLAIVFIIIFGLGLTSCSNKREGKPKVLVFSKTMGFKHASIPAGIAAIQKLGMENGFEVDTTKNAALFNEENLEKYSSQQQIRNMIGVGIPNW